MTRYGSSTAVDPWGRLQGSFQRKMQYLGFSVGSFRFGIPLLRFAEVRTLSSIMPVMHPPDYRYGRACFYGEMVPLLDLRVEMGCGVSFDQQTRVLVAWRSMDGFAEAKIGLIVDSVDTVQDTSELHVQMPTSGDLAGFLQILGVAIEGVHRRVLLDLDYWRHDLTRLGAIQAE